MTIGHILYMPSVANTHLMYTLDEGKMKGVRSGMGLFLSVGHLQKIRP
jgi:hypothetical protein